MILSDVQIEYTGENVIFSVDVKFERLLINKPKRAWIAFPAVYGQYISGRMDAFAAGLFPVALASGENIRVEGDLSPELLFGMGEYQRAYNNWFPMDSHVVDISVSNVSSLPYSQAGKACVSLFSGGVDSSYTVYSHLVDNQPLKSFQLDYSLFVQGFDIFHQDSDFYDACYRKYVTELGDSGVKLLSSNTNLQFFTSGLRNWRHIMGGAITAVGMALDKLINYYLVPSGLALNDLRPEGLTAMADHFLSTETFKVIHHGATVPRIEKLNRIKEWSVAHRSIRVCTNPMKRTCDQNCGACQKCVRTLIMLDIIGSLPNFKTFRPKNSWLTLLKWTPDYSEGQIYTLDMINFAWNKKKYLHVSLLIVADLRARFWGFIRRQIPKRLFQWLKNKKYPYEKNPFHPRFEVSPFEKL